MQWEYGSHLFAYLFNLYAARLPTIRGGSWESKQINYNKTDKKEEEMIEEARTTDQVEWSEGPHSPLPKAKGKEPGLCDSSKQQQIRAIQIWKLLY